MQSLSDIPMYTLRQIEYPDEYSSEAELEEAIRYTMCQKLAWAIYDSLPLTVGRKTLSDGSTECLYEAKIHILTPDQLDEIAATLRRITRFETAADIALKKLDTKTIH